MFQNSKKIIAITIIHLLFYSCNKFLNQDTKINNLSTFQEQSLNLQQLPGKLEGKFYRECFPVTSKQTSLTSIAKSFEKIISFGQNKTMEILYKIYSLDDCKGPAGQEPLLLSIFAQYSLPEEMKLSSNSKLDEAYKINLSTVSVGLDNYNDVPWINFTKVPGGLCSSTLSLAALDTHKADGTIQSYFSGKTCFGEKILPSNLMKYDILGLEDNPLNTFNSSGDPVNSALYLGDPSFNGYDGSTEAKRTFVFDENYKLFQD